MHLNYFRKIYTNIKYVYICWYILICIYVKLIKYVSIWILKTLSDSSLSPNVLFCPVLRFLSPLKLSPCFFLFLSSYYICFIIPPPLRSFFTVRISSFFIVLWFLLSQKNYTRQNLVGKKEWNSVFYTWLDCSSHEVTTAVATCARWNQTTF